jgi:thiol-disulfide isomerase/thioredoxin
MTTRAIVASLAVLLFLVALVAAKAVAAQESEAKKTTAPGWELNDLDGKQVKLSDFKRKVVILNFWATWCAPCRVEIPGFLELQKKYGDKGLAVIGVSVDEQGPEVVKEFVKQFQMTYPVVVGNEKIIEAYGGIDGIPTTFVIDREGRIIGKHIGYEDKETLEKEIQSLL